MVDSGIDRNVVTAEQVQYRQRVARDREEERMMRKLEGRGRKTAEKVKNPPKSDEEYAKYEAAWASGIHNGCRIALNNGLNTLEPVTVQMAVSKADDGKWSIDDDSIVKFDQALMFYPESFE